MSQLFENGTLNLTQSLFKVDEKLLKKSQMSQTSLPSASNEDVAGTYQSSQELEPVILNQFRMSNWYQDNQWQTLTSSNKWGLPLMGGPIDITQGSGTRPGNLYSGVVRQAAFKENNNNNITPSNFNGIYVPNFSMFGFSNN